MLRGSPGVPRVLRGTDAGGAPGTCRSTDGGRETDDDGGYSVHLATLGARADGRVTDISDWAGRILGERSFWHEHFQVRITHFSRSHLITATLRTCTASRTRASANAVGTDQRAKS